MEGRPDRCVNVLVAAEGIDLSTHTDELGQFTLGSVPAFQSLTIEAIADPSAALVSSRLDIVVGPGETLDIGALDLPVCPAPVIVAPEQSQQDTRDL